MKFSVSRIASLFIVFVISGQFAFSQVKGIADTTILEKKISILNKKLFLDLPARSVVSPRVADIMAADPNENRETRIITEWGKMKLVLFAQELYATSSKTLLADISNEVEPDFDFVRKQLTDKDSILTVLSTPSLFDSAAQGILVNSLLVKTPDNTVCRIDAYINPEAYAVKGEFIRLTENIFASISKGTRNINLSAKEETYKILSGGNKFLFKLPKNYFVTVDEKYDFSVYKITKFKDLTDKSFSSITIYSGFHPGWFHTEYGFTDSSAVKIKGNFLQTGVDWLYFADDPSKFYLKEQMIPSDAVEKGLIFHVAMLTNKKEVMDELLKIVEAIKVIK